MTSCQFRVGFIDGKLESETVKTNMLRLDYKLDPFKANLAYVCLFNYLNHSMHYLCDFRLLQVA